MRVDDDALARGLRPPPSAWQRTSLRRAAVLAPLFRRDDEDWLLFLVRRDDLREHAGQIAFPGGVDEQDADPIACALRETEEEVGIAPAAVRVLGEVATRQSSSRYRVHCLVGRVDDPGDVRGEPGEVARVLVVPMRELAEPTRWELRGPPGLPQDAPKRWPDSPHFQAGDDLIWGLTGRFTYDLIQALGG